MNRFHLTYFMQSQYLDMNDFSVRSILLLQGQIRMQCLWHLIIYYNGRVIKVLLQSRSIEFINKWTNKHLTFGPIDH